VDGPVEAIVEAYVHAANGDLRESLRLAVSDALADLTEVERRAERADRLISRGYARGETVSAGIRRRLLESTTLDITLVRHLPDRQMG
jgi:hypothetical protein